MAEHKQYGRGIRRGLTLVELMVVIMLVVLLVAAALPLAKPAFKDYKLQNAARELAGFCQGAQARAAERRSPVGIWIERSDYTTANGNARSLRVFMAETPPPYSGDATVAKAFIRRGTDLPGGTATWEVLFVYNGDSVPFLVNVGDTVRLDYKGPQYRIISVNAAGSGLPAWESNLSEIYVAGTPPAGQQTIAVHRVHIVSDGQPAPHESPSFSSMTPQPISWYVQYGVSFQITLQPRRSASASLELPNGICIDLTMSGIGARGRDFAPDVVADITQNMCSSPGPPPICQPNSPDGYNYGPIVVMFDPKGQVESVYYSQDSNPLNSTPTPVFASRLPVGMIHFLIGRTEQVYDYATPATNKIVPDLFFTNGDRFSNTMDLSTAWVSIVPNEGLIRTVENADSQGAVYTDKVETARQFTRSTLEMGGP